MNAFLRIASASTLALALSLSVSGCGGKKAIALTEAEANDPVANFMNGLSVLQTPDRDGVVDYATAYTRFQDAERLGAGPKASFNAGWIAEQLGRDEAALEHYKTAYEADSSYERGVFSYTRMLNEMGRAEDALAVHQASFEANPDSMDAHIAYIEALGKAGRTEDAHAEASRILLTDSANVDVYRTLSAMYQAKGDFGMAELLSQKAMSMMETQDPGVINNLAVADLVQGDEAAAIAKFKEALALTPGAFEPNINLGFIALNSGDYQLANDSFERATLADPSNLDAKLGLAVSKRGLGELEEADRLYAEIIKADPQYTLAYYNAATLHEKYTKNFNKAIKYLEAYITASGGDLPATDPVYAQMESVQAAKAAQAEIERQERQRREEEEARQLRNEQLLSGMSGTITAYQTKFDANTGCLDEMVQMEGSMILEQAQMVVDAEDAAMAADIQMLLEGYTPVWDEAIAGCEAGGGAPPAPEAPPTEEEPPVDEAPAPE